MEHEILNRKLVKYSKKYSKKTNPKKSLYYERKIEFYDHKLKPFDDFPQDGGNIGNKKYIAIMLNTIVYKLLGVSKNTFDVTSLLKNYGINQKSSSNIHSTILTFEIDPDVERLLDKSYDLNIPLTLHPYEKLLKSLPISSPKYITMNYTSLLKNILNIINKTEQLLVNNIRSVLDNITLIKIQVDSNNTVLYAYNIDSTHPQIKCAENTSPRYNISPFSINLPPLQLSPDPIVKIIHRYFGYSNKSWKEILTVYHYDVKNPNDHSTGILHVSISNNPNNSNQVISAQRELNRNLSHFNVITPSIESENIIVKWL